MPLGKKENIISVILAVLIAFMIVLYLNVKEKELKKSYTLVKVFVASREIPVRTTIDATMLETAELPEKFVETNAIVVKNFQRDSEKVVGNVSAVPILKGQRILQSFMTPPSEFTGLAPKIPVGMRTVIIPISNMDIFGLIKPGDKVDLINVFSVQARAGGSVKVASTIAQNVQILNVGKDLEFSMFKKKGKDDEGKTGGSMSVLYAGVLVSPEDAQLIALGMSQGDIVISIRSSYDSDLKMIPAISSDIFVK